MVRKFPSFRSEWKKRSTFEGTPQFPNGMSGKLPYHLTSNRNFCIFWPNGKHPLLDLLVDWPEYFLANQRDGFRLFWDSFGKEKCLGALSIWRQKCRSPENIASSQLVAPGSPRMTTGTFRRFEKNRIDRFHVTSSDHQSFYPHQAKEAAYLYLFTILQLNSVLRLETRAF